MAPDHLPLSIVELPGLVQDPRRYGQLADVMQQRGPAQPIPVFGGKLHLLGQKIGEDSNSFRMTPRPAVVRLKRGCQREDPLGRPGFRLGVGTDRCQPRPQPTHTSRLSRHCKSRGRPVGKEHREPEQHDQRKEPAAQTLDERGHDDSKPEHPDPPGDPTWPWSRRGNERTHAERNGQSQQSRHDQDEDAKREGEDWASPPAVSRSGPFFHPSKHRSEPRR